MYTGEVHPLGDVNTYDSRGKAFDRTGALVGVSYAADRKPSSAKTAIVFESDSGAQLSRAGARTFVSFFDCSKRALLVREKVDFAEVWSMKGRVRLQEVKLVDVAGWLDDSPRLHLDDLLFWRSWAGHLKVWPLTLGTVKAKPGTAMPKPRTAKPNKPRTVKPKLQLSQITLLCCSPDNTCFARVCCSRMIDRETLALEKLC